MIEDDEHADDRHVVVESVTGVAGITVARALVRRVTTDVLPAERVDDAVLVVSELVTNALEHALEHALDHAGEHAGERHLERWSGKPVEVTVVTSDDVVEVAVSARSAIMPSITPSITPSIDRRPAADALSGRGLHIVAQLSDEVIVSGDRGTVCVTCTFRR